MNVSRRIETGANISVIVLTALFGWTVIRGGITRPSPTSKVAQEGPKAGMDLNRGPLKGVNWSVNGRTLVLGLQTTCHFCTESGPFFQKLQPTAAGATRIIAVLPQGVDDSKKYLEKLGVRVDEVRSAPLSDIGVSGTPTLLLADDKGTVRNIWIGKLGEDRQPDVLSAIAPKKTARPAGL